MTVRVGFLGGGFIAHYHGKMLHTSDAEVEIAAVHDPDRAKAAAFGSASGARVVESEAELIESVDAVYVTTWTSEHRRLVEAVAAAGKPLFCEKPLGTNLTDVVAMIDAVDRAGITNQVGLVLRDSPAFAFLRAMVQRPESGRLMSIVFRDDQFIPIQGMYGSTWRADVSKAGAGTLIEHSIHDLDLIEWIAGDVTEVQGRTAEFHGIDGIEDVAVASLAFAGGGFGTLTSLWHDILERPSLRRVEVFCERGFYALEGDVDGPVHWTTGSDRGSVQGQDLFEALHALGHEVRNPDAGFIQAVQEARPATPDLASALRAHVLAEGLYASANHAGGSGTPVPVPPGRPPAGWPGTR